MTRYIQNKLRRVAPLQESPDALRNDHIKRVIHTDKLIHKDSLCPSYQNDQYKKIDEHDS